MNIVKLTQPNQETQPNQGTEIEELLRNLTDPNKDRILLVLERGGDQFLKSLKHDKEFREESPKMADKILENLKKYHRHIDKNAEMMGYKGKKVTITLPAVGDFKGFEFNCFVSYQGVTFTEMIKSDARDYIYTREKRRQLMEKITEYMKASFDETKKDFNNGIELKDRERYINEKLGTFMLNIIGLDKHTFYWDPDDEEGTSTYRSIVENGTISSCSRVKDWHKWYNPSNKLFMEAPN